jgi:hypothetical protein
MGYSPRSRGGVQGLARGVDVNPRQTGIAGEDSVWGNLAGDRLGDLPRFGHALASQASRNRGEIVARLRISRVSRYRRQKGVELP